LTWRIVAIGLVGVGGLLATGSASAASPTREAVGVFPYEFSADCGPYGFDFAINVQGAETVRVATFYNADGEPVRIVVHSTFRETDTNSVTGALPFRGLLVRTLDPVAGTRTDVGRMFLMTDPRPRNRRSGCRPSRVRCAVPRVLRGRTP
jgi:hypothetical protein